MIEKLTEEHKSHFPEYIEKWTKIGRDTSVIDKRRIKENLIQFVANEPDYQQIDKFCWCGSPMSAILGAMLLSKKGISIFDENGDQIPDWPELSKIIDQHFSRIEISSFINESANKCIFGQQDAAWLSIYDFINRVLGVDLKDNRINNLFNLAECSNWIFAIDKIAFCSHKPKKIEIADGTRNDELHTEVSPNIEYPDGYGTYFWHNIQVPGFFINKNLSRKLDAQTALTWPNIEQRRCACEILGWDNILKELDCTVIDEDVDPEVGKLLEVTIPDIGKERFLQVLCGTGRTFALPVPPNMTTALQAQAWTWDLGEFEFKKPEVRT